MYDWPFGKDKEWCDCDTYERWYFLTNNGQVIMIFVIMILSIVLLCILLDSFTEREIFEIETVAGYN